MRLCFVHIPKCGGSSVTAALMQHTRKHRGLDANAARSAGEYLGRPFGRFTHEILAYYLWRDLELLYGHYEVSPRLLDAHPDWDFVTLLREPVARFLSNLYFNRTHPSWRDMFPEGEPIESFLDGVEAQKFGHNYVSSLGLDNPRSSGAIRAAKQLLSEKFAVVGCLEQLDDFNERMRSDLGLDLNIEHRNRSPERPETSDQVLRQIRDLCAPNIEIYEYVRNTLVRPSRRNA